MATDLTTKNELKQAFNADFFYAFILATFLLFNGLAFSDYIYFNHSNDVGFFINLNEDSFDIAYDICNDEIISTDELISELNTCLNDDLIAEKSIINSELNDDLINNKEINKSELNQDITSINSTLNDDYIINKSLSNVALNQNNRIINPELITQTNKTLTTTIPAQETISKNQITQSAQVPQSVTSESYMPSAPIRETPRPANVSNTTHNTITYTSHTYNIKTPQNKTFIKSAKNTSNASKIDLENLPEVSSLLSDLIKTADLQGKNIILSFGAKWCLPCKQMEKNVYNNLEVNGTIHRDYVFQKLDEKDLEAITLKNLFDVKVYPTTLIVDTRGNVISRYEEGLSKNRMMNILAENIYRPAGDEVIVKADASSQPIELEAAIDFLVSRTENSTLDFD